MGKLKGFMEYQRKDGNKPSPKERLENYNEHFTTIDSQTLKEQAARCMDCGIPFCSSGVLLNNRVTGCPLHNLIPEWNQLVYEGKMEDAYKRLIKTNPFPEFTSRVCPAPCEGACTNGLHYESVTIKNIEYEISKYAFEHDLVKAYKGPKRKEVIAVIGSGPSGLSTAHYLSQYGYQVSVFEKEDRFGGLLVYGIPSMKLDKDVVSRRIQILKESGVTFINNTSLGKDISLDQLEEEFDAIVLAMGTEQARDIEVLGRDKMEVIFALDYLKDSIRNVLEDSELTYNAQDKNVIIIGGGDTATDCLATALRQKAKSVTQFEIMPEKPKTRVNNPWPEYPNTLKTDYGQDEAIFLHKEDPRVYKTLIKEIKDKQVESVQIDWVKEGNRFQMKESSDTSVWDADMVIIAAGFEGPNNDLLKQEGIQYDQRGYRLTNSYLTNRDKVYIVGDMRKGQSLVVSAMQEGKEVAKKIHSIMTQ